jgi:hypothetical protein
MRFQKSRGVISIFLIIIMIPMMTLSVLLVDGSRVRSAKAITQELSDLAVASVLADHNTLLKSEFGLFALNDASMAEEMYNYYLQKSLNARSASKAPTYTEMVQGLVKQGVFGGGQYMEKNFINLYDFDIDSSTVNPVHNLTDVNVLESQIADYVKYRAVLHIFSRMGILGNASEVANEMKNMEACTKLTKDFVEAASKDEGDAKLFELKKAVEEYKDGLGDLKSEWEACAKAAEAYAKKIPLKEDDEEEDGEEEELTPEEQAEADEKAEQEAEERKDLKEKYEEAKKKFDEKLTKAKEKLVKINTAYTACVDALNNASTEYGKFVSDKQSGANASGSEDQKNIVADAAGAQTDSETKLTELEKWNREKLTPVKNIFTQIEQDEKKIDDLLTQTQPVEESPESEIQGLNNAVKNNVGANTEISAEGIPVNKASSDEGKKNKDNLKKVSEGVKERTETSAEEEKVKLSDAIYKSLPSQKADDAESAKERDTDFNLDADNADDGKSSADKALTMPSFDIGALANVVGKDILTYSYMFGTFKSRVTSSDKVVKPSSFEQYHVQWRYEAAPDGSVNTELDLRGRTKKDLATVFSSAELEYIFAGKQSESSNENIVYAWIYGMRLPGNIIAVYSYMNKPVKENIIARGTLEALATAASAATLGIVPQRVFYWLFIIALAAGETAYEMSMLIDYGYRLPLFKKAEDVMVTDLAKAVEVVSNAISGTPQTPKVGSGIKLCYEDYLLLLMLAVGRETRLLRTADLIQLNMNKRGGSYFVMDDAYVDLKADSNVSIKFLFQSTSQFSWGYPGTGIRFKNTIFQGY